MLSIIVKCNRYDKNRYAYESIFVQCNRIALLMISIVVQCIGIALLMISILVQCIRIALLMISIVVQCIGIIAYDKHTCAMH